MFRIKLRVIHNARWRVMPSLDEVNRQIAAYPNPYIFWTRKEINTLPEILDDDESIKAITSGMINSRTWLAVCTDRRFICLNCNMFFGLAQVQMPLNRIQSIDHEFTIFFGSIRVFDGINVIKLSMILKPAILPFVKAFEEQLYNYRHTATRATANAPTTGSPDIAGQIAKLAELKEKGYLTDEEFQTQKKKLLAG